jgi:hypothetical protein
MWFGGIFALFYHSLLSTIYCLLTVYGISFNSTLRLFLFMTESDDMVDYLIAETRKVSLMVEQSTKEDCVTPVP